MSVNLATRQIGDVTLVDVVGRITLGESSKALRDTIRDLIGKNQNKVLLSLTEVTYIDSAGIGELVYTYSTVTNGGGRLILLNPSKRVRDLLLLTKLYSVFEVQEDEAAAIRSFSSKA